LGILKFFIFYKNFPNSIFGMPTLNNIFFMIMMFQKKEKIISQNWKNFLGNFRTKAE